MSSDYELHRLTTQTPAFFDETVRRQVESLEKEVALLEREAEELAKEIEEAWLPSNAETMAQLPVLRSNHRRSELWPLAA